jgi:hypothetical protein
MHVFLHCDEIQKQQFDKDEKSAWLSFNSICSHRVYIRQHNI